MKKIDITLAELLVFDAISMNPCRQFTGDLKDKYDFVPYVDDRGYPQTELWEARDRLNNDGIIGIANSGWVVKGISEEEKKQAKKEIELEEKKQERAEDAWRKEELENRDVLVKSIRLKVMAVFDFTEEEMTLMERSNRGSLMMLPYMRGMTGYGI